jgi:tRNA (guanine-N7-)-methyltransferase
LDSGGTVHLKTDNQGLFEYTLKTVTQLKHEGSWPIGDLVWTEDLYQSSFLKDQHGLQTNFEQKYLQLGQPIYYLRFTLTEM